MKIVVNSKRRIRFVIVLSVVLAIGLVLHAFLMHLFNGDVDPVVYVSYGAHWGFSLVAFFSLVRFGRTKGEYLGYAFLVLTMFKFLLYVGFRWYFVRDGEVTKAEYAIFFLPYLISLVVEVVFFAMLLNNAPIDKDRLIDYSNEEEE